MKPVYYHIIFGLACLLIQPLAAQKVTSVKGQVFDAKTEESMPYVNVNFEGTNLGATSDIDGNFYIETRTKVSKIRITYVGYKSQVLDIKYGEANVLNIKMEDGSIDLNELTVHVEKYRNKGNPAVELIRKVIDNKDKNRKESFDYYNYQRYDKIQFSINNITDDYKKKRIFKKFQFIFENVDTNKASGKVNLPVFLKENLSNVYYRKNPTSQKEFILGEKLTGLEGYIDNDGISAFMGHLYQDVNIYDNAITMSSVQLVSPLSPLSPTIYRFYILDTSIIKSTPMVHMYFAPRNKTDLAFIGHMWIALDSTYAVRKIELGIPKDINLNWVNEMQIAQEFDWFETPGGAKGLMLIKDETMMDFGILKNSNGRTILGKKVSSYKDYTLNIPLPDSLFRTNVKYLKDEQSVNRDEAFWQQNRHDTLSLREQGIYKMVDSIPKVPAFKRAADIAILLLAGYKSFGWFDLGPVNTFYSFNTIEGFRPRLGGRTNQKLSPYLMLEGYGAYGVKDKRWKYYLGATYSLNHQFPMKFPIHQVKVWYQNETRIPGQELEFVQEDNFLLSFKRGVNDKMIYNNNLGIEYSRERRDGISYSLSVKNLIQKPAGSLRFEYIDQGETHAVPDIQNTELGLRFRYAPNEQFYQGKTYRQPILNKYPIFTFQYAGSLKNFLNSDYTYHNLSLKIEKAFFLSPIGHSILIVEGGYINGKIPYPLLTIHHANQTYSYQLESFNMMNFLEFVSDKYVSLNYYHNFGGILFNRIPLIKKLKWREVISFKGLWGGLDKNNQPNTENGLFQFPTDKDGNTITYTLEKQPYMEASVGVANIFKLFRIDVVRRLNYYNHPHVTKTGLRMRFRVDF